jgi:tungstate transport system ATP-binding protein
LQHGLFGSRERGSNNEVTAMSTAGPSHLRIRFDGVRVDVGGIAILRNVSLDLAGGAPTVRVGPNGSGKTTLIRAAMGLVPLTAGSIRWGERGDSAPPRSALVFQRPVMLRRSVTDNLRYALSVAGVPRSQRAPRTLELLSLVGLSSLAARPAPRLSGGERQRLSLARALARDPDVLFLDEPTASLDPAATLAIEDLVRAVAARGVKVVMSTHDLGEAARLAGDVVLLHRGAVVESGPASQVLGDPQTEVARRFLAGQLVL